MSLFVQFIIFICFNNSWIKSQPITGQNNIGVTESSFLEYWYICEYDLEYNNDGSKNIVDQKEVEEEIKNNFNDMQKYNGSLNIQTYINNFIKVKRHEIGTNNLGVSNESFYEFMRLFQLELSKEYFRQYNMLLHKDNPDWKTFMQEELNRRFLDNKTFGNIQDFINNLNAVEVLNTGYNEIHVKKEIYKNYIDLYMKGLMKAFHIVNPSSPPTPLMLRYFFEIEIIGRYEQFIEKYKTKVSLETFLNTRIQTYQKLIEKEIISEEEAERLAIRRNVEFGAASVPPEFNEFNETQYNYEEENEYLNKFRYVSLKEETSSSSKKKRNKGKERAEV